MVTSTSNPSHLHSSRASHQPVCLAIRTSERSLSLQTQKIPQMKQLSCGCDVCVSVITDWITFKYNSWLTKSGTRFHSSHSFLWVIPLLDCLLSASALCFEHISLWGEGWGVEHEQPRSSQRHLLDNSSSNVSTLTLHRHSTKVMTREQTSDQTSHSYRWFQSHSERTTSWTTSWLGLCIVSCFSIPVPVSVPEFRYWYQNDTFFNTNFIKFILTRSHHRKNKL